MIATAHVVQQRLHRFRFPHYVFVLLYPGPHASISSSFCKGAPLPLCLASGSPDPRISGTRESSAVPLPPNSFFHPPSLLFQVHFTRLSPLSICLLPQCIHIPFQLWSPFCSNSDRFVFLLYLALSVSLSVLATIWLPIVITPFTPGLRKYS